MAADTTTQVQTMNELGLTVKAVFEVGYEDTERFVKAIADGLAKFTKLAATSENADLFRSLLEQFQKSASAYLEAQKSLPRFALEGVADAILKLGIADDFERLVIRKGSQPHPEAEAEEDDVLAGIGGGIVIDPETGESRVVDAEEARRLYKECRERKQDD